MSARVNSLGQPIGADLSDWQQALVPPRSAMEGRYCRVEPVEPARHAGDLFNAFQLEPDDRHWTYMWYGPFADRDAFETWLTETSSGDDPILHAIVDLGTGKATGLAGYVQIKPKIGVLEAGHINYSPLLQRRAAATEAMYLMMHRVFEELGYRRYEWQTDTLNARSRRAAERLGFTLDAVFPQAVVAKGLNRDTAWYSIIDKDWPKLKRGFEHWLNPENFGGDGRQKLSLEQCRAD